MHGPRPKNDKLWPWRKFGPLLKGLFLSFDIWSTVLKLWLMINYPPFNQWFGDLNSMDPISTIFWFLNIQMVSRIILGNKSIWPYHAWIRGPRPNDKLWPRRNFDQQSKVVALVCPTMCTVVVDVGFLIRFAFQARYIYISCDYHLILCDW